MSHHRRDQKKKNRRWNHEFNIWWCLFPIEIRTRTTAAVTRPPGQPMLRPIYLLQMRWPFFPTFLPPCVPPVLHGALSSAHPTANKRGVVNATLPKSRQKLDANGWTRIIPASKKTSTIRRREVWGTKNHLSTLDRLPAGRSKANYLFSLFFSFFSYEPYLPLSHIAHRTLLPVESSFGVLPRETTLPLLLVTRPQQPTLVVHDPPPSGGEIGRHKK